MVAQVEEAPITVAAGTAEDADASYTTPPAADAGPGLAPAELANFLVAHYGYASPLMRRSMVAGLIAEPAEAVAPAPDAATGQPPGQQ